MYVVVEHRVAGSDPRISGGLFAKQLQRIRQNWTFGYTLLVHTITPEAYAAAHATSLPVHM